MLLSQSRSISKVLSSVSTYKQFPRNTKGALTLTTLHKSNLLGLQPNLHTQERKNVRTRKLQSSLTTTTCNAFTHNLLFVI